MPTHTPRLFIYYLHAICRSYLQLALHHYTGLEFWTAASLPSLLAKQIKLLFCSRSIYIKNGIIMRQMYAPCLLVLALGLASAQVRALLPLGLKLAGPPLVQPHTHSQGP
jgi:hypothetical protein